MMRVSDFRLGMVVRHAIPAGRGLGLGRVTAVGTDGVKVHYDAGNLDALYDNDWFRYVQDGHVILELVEPGEEIDGDWAE